MTSFLVYLAINSPQNYGYNYGLGYVASVLKKNGHDVSYFTLNNKKDVLALYKDIQAKNPDIIGFSATTPQFCYLKDITRRIKSFSSSFIICGGPHPTLDPE